MDDDTRGYSKHDPIVLTQEQRELFFEQGFLAVEGLVSDEWLDCLRRRSDEMTERSRQFTESNKEYDLSPDHTADNPYVRRLRPRSTGTSDFGNSRITRHLPMSPPIWLARM